MQELLEKIVKGIVNNPDEVSVVERESVDFPGLTILEITVADSDKGILIGRRGRTINAIRDIMTISAIRNDRKIKVLVKEDREGERHDGPRDQRDTREERHDENRHEDHIEEGNRADEAPSVPENSDEVEDILDDDM